MADSPRILPFRRLPLRDLCRLPFGLPPSARSAHRSSDLGRKWTVPSPIRILALPGCSDLKPPVVAQLLLQAQGSGGRLVGSQES